PLRGLISYAPYFTEFPENEFSRTHFSPRGRSRARAKPLSVSLPQRDHVRGDCEGRWYFAPLARRDDHVVVFASPKPPEHGSRLLRLDRRRIVEHDAQLAFVLAAELPHFESARTGGGLPVDVTSRILRHVLANPVKIVAAPAHKRLEFARNHGQDVKELFGRLDHRIDDDFARQINAPGLHQESKRKARGQPEVLFLITAARRKTHLEIGAQLLPRGQKRKVDGVLQNRPFRFHADPPQPPVGQANPLLFGRAVSRHA